MVALYLPRIFVKVVVALEGCHSDFTDGFLLIVQLALNLRGDFAPVGIMQPLHRSLIVRYSSCVTLFGEISLCNFLIMYFLMLGLRGA